MVAVRQPENVGHLIGQRGIKVARCTFVRPERIHHRRRWIVRYTWVRLAGTLMLAGLAGGGGRPRG